MDRPFDVICLGRAAVDLYGLQFGGRLEDMQRFEIRELDAKIGAVLTIENMREGVPIADAKNDQAGQPLRVRNDMTDIDALGRQGLAYEAPHVLVTDPGQH